MNREHFFEPRAPAVAESNRHLRTCRVCVLDRTDPNRLVSACEKGRLLHIAYLNYHKAIAARHN